MNKYKVFMIYYNEQDSIIFTIWATRIVGSEMTIQTELERYNTVQKHVYIHYTVICTMVPFKKRCK